MDSHSTPIDTTLPSGSNALFRLSWRQVALCQIHRLTQAISDYLTQGNEPKIAQRIHQNGQIVWTVYDPHSNQHTTCASEAEVRFWLEQRYHAH